MNILKWWSLKKFKMNCMIRFNCCLGYHLIFIILVFHHKFKLWHSWKLCGISPILSLYSAYIPSILDCQLFCLIWWISGVMVKLSIMVEIWQWDDFGSINFLVSFCWSDFLIRFVPRDTSRGIYPEIFSRDIVSLSKNLGTQIFQGDFPG